LPKLSAGGSTSLGSGAGGFVAGHMVLRVDAVVPIVRSLYPATPPQATHRHPYSDLPSGLGIL